MDVGNRPELGTPEYEAWGMDLGRQLWRETVEQVRTVVNDNNLTQSQIAQDTGISQPMISRFLKGNDNPMTFERLTLLLDYLGFSWSITLRTCSPPQNQTAKASKPSAGKVMRAK